MWLLLKETVSLWKDRDPFNNSSIIAYYTIFSLPGLLLIIISSASYFYDKKEVTSRITNQIQSVMGADTANDISAIIEKTSENTNTFTSSIFGILTILFGATGVFYELKQMFNKIWMVEAKTKTRQRILALITDRVFSFGLILAVGFLLLVSLVLSAILNVISDWVAIYWSESLNFLFRGADILVSVGIITLLFASLYKFLPDTTIQWKMVWPGAFLTALLFVVAKFGLAFYFSKTHFSSMYGAAGSIILIMLWVSYTGLILLFGAEFTHVYHSRKVSGSI